MRLALGLLEERFGPLRRASLYASEPVLGERSVEGPHPDYLNTAALGRLTSPRGARAVLAELKAIERRAGRRHGKAGPRKECPGRDAPRPLDIDLLLAGDALLDLPALGGPPGPGEWPGAVVVPHPRLAERRFVLLPLCDLIPDRPLAPSGSTPRQMLAALGDAQAVERVPWRRSAPRNPL